MTRLVINGGCGKMGRRIIALAFGDRAVKVTAALERKGHPDIGARIEGILVTDDADCIKTADVVIDFSTPDAAMSLLKIVLGYKKALVVGTTGFSPAQLKEIKEAALSIPVVFSPNMSISVNLLFRLVKEAAEKLKGYKVKIKEAHHIHKKDAPSGTAKKIAEIIQEQTGKRVDDIESIREGEIIGDHEVILESDLDRVVISHSAKNRDIFAKGSLEAAKWVKGKPSGLFSMQDVLG